MEHVIITLFRKLLFIILFKLKNIFYRILTYFFNDRDGNFLTRENTQTMAYQLIPGDLRSELIITTKFWHAVIFWQLNTNKYFFIMH